MGDVSWLNQQCTKLFKGINDAQKVLENTYIRFNDQNNTHQRNVHLTTNDLDRSDMGCLKKKLYHVMNQFHIKEILENNNSFGEDNQTSAKTAVEDSMPPIIPIRSQTDEMSEAFLKSLCKQSTDNITYLNLFNNKIKKIHGLSNLKNLKTLILSFNNIEEIRGLENCISLIKLDL